MIMLMTILIIVTGLSYLSQRQTMNYVKEDGRKQWDIYLILLVVFLILFAGLRTSYNDTGNYIKGFQNSVNITAFLADKENLNLMHNPLFYGFQSLIRTFTNNFTVFFMICAIIVNILNVRFIKRNVEAKDFAFCMFLYVTLGTLMLSIAAQKQILAMSILTIALNYLFDKKYIKYYLIVFLAGLIHTYAWLFFFLPLFAVKPWSIRTFLMLGITLIIMYSFQGVINSLLEVADQVGKNIPMEEVFDGNRMNIFRVGVYAVVPATALLFKRRINNGIDVKYSIFIHMSIISLMFMLMGTQDGANMFGRSGNYFELGIICSLPWLVRQLFTRQSVTIILLIATMCFTGFYLYDNQGFEYLYRHKPLIQFIGELLS